MKIEDIKCENINRVEVIDGTGRAYTNWSDYNLIELYLQDGGKTLKIFVSKKQGDIKDDR